MKEKLRDLILTNVSSSFKNGESLESLEDDIKVPGAQSLVA
jgi:hypothetical protein